jgi:hypothetical protein
LDLGLLLLSSLGVWWWWYFLCRLHYCRLCYRHCRHTLVLWGIRCTTYLCNKQDALLISAVSMQSVHSAHCFHMVFCTLHIHVNTLHRLTLIYIICDRPVPTALRTGCVSIIRTKQLMLFQGKITVCYENHKKHINTPCFKMQSLNVTADDTYTYQHLTVSVMIYS